MLHKMILNKAPFDKINKGIKTIELRLYDEKRRLMSEGDIIEFTCGDDRREVMLCRIIKMHIFDSFEALYSNLPLLKCGYTKSDIDTASPKDMKEYYSSEKEELYGVVGIEIKLI